MSNDGPKGEVGFGEGEEYADDRQAAGSAGAPPGRGGLFQDSVRKVLVGGASALLMTEENIRNALSDVRLPKDAVSFLLQQTDRTRREVMRVVTKEVKNAVDKVDVRGELRRALVGLNVDVRATVRFREDGQPSEFSLRRRRRRRAKSPGAAPVEAKDEAAPAAAAATPQNAESPGHDGAAADVQTETAPKR